MQTRGQSTQRPRLGYRPRGKGERPGLEKQLGSGGDEGGEGGGAWSGWAARPR